MTDHSKNLEVITASRDSVAKEIQSLEQQLNIKKEIFLKYSGIIEYLEQTESAQESSTTEVAADVEATVDDQLPG